MHCTRGRSQAERLDNRGGKRTLSWASVPLGGAMRSFIHRKNLENFRKQLAETSDDATRLQLERLLSEEEAKEPAKIEKRDHD